jgi:hypothetical protein
LLKELDIGSDTKVIYIILSSLITGVNHEEKLIATIKELDEKFKALIMYIISIYTPGHQGDSG